MKRIERRAVICWFLAGLLTVGLVIFLGKYFVSGGELGVMHHDVAGEDEAHRAGAGILRQKREQEQGQGEEQTFQHETS